MSECVYVRTAAEPTTAVTCAFHHSAQKAAGHPRAQNIHILLCRNGFKRQGKEGNIGKERYEVNNEHTKNGHG